MQHKRETITQELIKELFEYVNGDLVRKITVGRRGKIGSVAGTNRPMGYIHTAIAGKKYLNHRLIFLMFHGYLPKYIDHINGDKSNNTIENLREATASENNRNSKSCKNSTPKYLGVWRRKEDCKWVAGIRVKGKPKHLGRFTDEAEAARAYDKAAKKYYGEFANLNFKDNDNKDKEKNTCKKN